MTDCEVACVGPPPTSEVADVDTLCPLAAFDLLVALAAPPFG